VALFCPDHVQETFRPSTSHGGHDVGDRSLRYLEWSYDPDPDDTTTVTSFAFLLKDGAGPVRCEQDEHVLGLGHAYRDAALASPALFDLMFGRPIADFEPDESARAVAMGTFTPVVAAARAWLAARGGPVDTESPLRLARAFWATTHGVVTLETAGLLGSDVAPAMLDDLLTSVLAAEETRLRNVPVT
jgi:hypothetical protein